MDIVLRISHSDKGAQVESYQSEIDYKETSDSIIITDNNEPSRINFSGEKKNVFSEERNYDLLDENNVSYKLFKSQNSIKLIRMDNSYDGEPYVWIFDK